VGDTHKQKQQQKQKAQTFSINATAEDPKLSSASSSQKNGNNNTESEKNDAKTEAESTAKMLKDAEVVAMAGMAVIKLVHDSKSLKTLFLSSCDLNSAFAREMSLALTFSQTHALEVLVLDDNVDISSVGATHLGRALETNKTIKNLSLRGCGITDFTSVCILYVLRMCMCVCVCIYVFVFVHVVRVCGLCFVFWLCLCCLYVCCM